MNEVITQFHFLRPAAFLLLIPVVLVWWIWQRETDPLRGWRKQMDTSLLDALLVGRESSLRGPKRWLLAGWILSVVLVAGPTWRLEPSPFADDSTPLMVLLKADVSMDTPDPAPSRLERAHLKIADLAAARSGQPLGLIVYAGTAHLVLPPTSDTAVVAQMAEEISPEIMPKAGDRLDLALREARRVLDRASVGGSLLVVSDTVDTDPGLLEAASEELKYPLQILEIRAPDSASDSSVAGAARILGASVETMAIDDADISAIVRKADRSRAGSTGDEGERWEESGYWLLPLLGVLLLSTFRRTRTEEEMS